jgi:hypothetical protein
MDEKKVAALEPLLGAAIKARDGYRRASGEAEAKGLAPLAKTMNARHSEDADELAAELEKRGSTAGEPIERSTFPGERPPPFGRRSRFRAIVGLTIASALPAKPTPSTRLAALSHDR